MNETNNIELVSPALRKQMADRAESLGKNFPVKVVNFREEVKILQDSRIEENMSPYIHINQTKKLNRQEHQMKDRTQSLTYQRDKDYNVYYGIPAALYPDDNIKWRRIMIGENFSLDIRKADEAKIWIVLRMHRKVKGSPWQVTDPIYQVFDEELEAKKDLLKTKELKEAFKRIDKLDPVQLILFARTLRTSEHQDFDLSFNTSYDVIQAKVLNFAHHDPILFNKIWNSNDRAYKEVFVNGYAVGIIDNKQGMGYYFGSTFLGQNDEQAISFMKDDPQLTEAIRREVFEKDTLLLNYTTDKKKDKKSETKKDNNKKEEVIKKENIEILEVENDDEDEENIDIDKPFVKINN